MSPALLKLLALAAGTGMAAAPLIGQGDEESDPTQYGSVEEYLADESVPIEKRMATASQRAETSYDNSQASKDKQAKLAALAKLRGR